MSSSSPPRRALVLGGGGSTGSAWMIGVIAGLADAGLDVTVADLVVGTSAGATTAAQITAASPTQLFAATLTSPGPRARPAGPPRREGGAVARPVLDHLERTRRIIAESTDPADLRRRLGAAALQLDAGSDAGSDTGSDTGSDAARHARWRATVAARLPSQHWPDRLLWITVVDARTGQPVVLDRHSGVDLADAVAASCASGAPHGIGGQRFIDGGYRRNENADLASGYDRVLVLSPFGGRARTPVGWDLHLSAQVAELRSGGSRVETICPEPVAEHLFGANAMDLSLRPDAARAGHAQGLAAAPRIAGLWH